MSPRRPRNRALLAVGAALICGGLAVVGWSAWLLVGTNILAARAQEQAVGRLLEQWEHPPSARAPSARVPGAILSIPKLDLVAPVVEGVDPDDLKRGVGHFPGSAGPGERGNFAIAGHRTTYGRPFWRADRLVPGDRVYVTTAAGQAAYVVTGSEVVTPDRVDVVQQPARPGDRVLTITTCHPRFSAARRLVIRATYDPARG